MELTVKAFSQAEWTDITSGFQDLSLMQTWEYAEAKATREPWRVERAVFTDGGRLLGAVQALIRLVPLIGGGLAWINRGPLWRRSAGTDPAVLAEMMRAVRRYWAEQRRLYLRVAPPLLASENDSAQTGVGYVRVDGEPGWASALLDLSQPLEELCARMSRNWRRNLDKATGAGVTVASGPEESLFATFLADYRMALTSRTHRSSVTPELLSCLYRMLPPERKLWALVGRKGDTPLGSLLIARYGTTAEYLAEAVNDMGRALGTGQLLHWCAVEGMKNAGCRRFDLGGLDPERTPKGILEFKSGLRGKPYRLVGEFEAGVDDWRAQVVRWRVRRARQAAGI